MSDSSEISRSLRAERPNLEFLPEKRCDRLMRRSAILVAAMVWLGGCSNTSVSPGPTAGTSNNARSAGYAIANPPEGMTLYSSGRWELSLHKNPILTADQATRIETLLLQGETVEAWTALDPEHTDRATVEQVLHELGTKVGPAAAKEMASNMVRQRRRALTQSILPWTLTSITARDIERLETKLGEFWAKPDERMQKGPSLDPTRASPGAPNHLSDYYIRYAGLLFDGRRLIAGSGVHRSAMSGETVLNPSELGVVMTGARGAADSYFQVLYDADANELIEVAFGSARTF